MRYYLDDKGGWLTASGDGAPFGGVPTGYREVTEEEYRQATGDVPVAPPGPPESAREPEGAPAKARRKGK